MGKKKRVRDARAHKKNRATSLIADLGEAGGANVRGLKVSTDGRITLLGANGEAIAPAVAWVQTTYSRAKGDKVINQIALPPVSLALNPELALTKYEWIFAVDTNTPKVGGAVTFTGIVQARVELLKPNLYQTGILRHTVLELHNGQHSPERFGWWLVISSIRGERTKKDVAILVDAHLSEIPAINRRELPVFGSNLLPEGFELIYASSDKPNDSTANWLLWRADGNAREVSEIAARPDSAKPPFVKINEAGPSAVLRIWEKHGPAA